MTFANQVAVITGASSGIGRELAKELARQGARVGLVARRGDLLEQLAGEIRTVGGTTAFAVADVAERQPTLAAVRDLTERLGPIDLLVANAGVGPPTTLDPVNIAVFERMYRVNVFGVVYAFEAVLPAMLARGRGHLAAVSSLAGYQGLPGEWGYTSTKAALNNLMDGLRIQLRDRGIAVTNICPGFVQTPMTANNRFDMPWLLSADEAARRIARALARRKKVFNFPWQMGVLMKLIRWLPDWAIARAMRKYNEDPPFPTAPVA